MNYAFFGGSHLEQPPNILGRFDAELTQNVCSVHFHRTLRNAAAFSGFAVREAKRNELSERTLTFSEGGEPLERIFSGKSRRSRGARPSRTGDRVEKTLVVDGLQEKIKCAVLHRPHRHIDVAVTGEKNDRERNAALLISC